MANTKVRIHVVSDSEPVTALLSTTEAGQVAPSASGYVLTFISGWTYELTVTEACVGIYQVDVWDGDGANVSLGYTWIKADDVGPYRAAGDYETVRLRKDYNDWADGGRLDTILDSILADTNELQTDLVNGGRLDTILDSILADTNELQTDWADGGRLDEVLSGVEGKTGLIGSGAATINAPVAEDGSLSLIVIGDDYNASNDRAFVWEFDAITGFTIGSAQGRFGVKNPQNGEQVFLVNAGTTKITDVGDGRWRVEFDVDKADTQDAIQGSYDYSAEIHQGGEEVTIVRNSTPRGQVRLVYKQTNE